MLPTLFPYRILYSYRHSTVFGIPLCSVFYYIPLYSIPLYSVEYSEGLQS